MFEKLLVLIKQVMPDVDTASAKPESRLVEDLHFDSIGIMMLAMAIEDEFGISFDGPMDFVTVQDVISFIESKK